MQLYPLRFDPIFCYRMWGGEKLKTLLKKSYTESSVGESWEISSVEGFQTKVAEGPLQGKTLDELIELFGADLLGRKNLEQFGRTFPLLIKFIDAAQPLSIQVHPSDELARQRHDSFGKNEMWYIMGADPGAELIVGFKESIDKARYEALLETGDLLSVMKLQEVHPGDAFYIPTGRVHAIGAGVLLAEIQQTSDITYRIFDYNRKDQKTGKTRTLHTAEALDALDFEVQKESRSLYNTDPNTENLLVDSPYFKTHFLKVEHRFKLDYSDLDSFVVLIGVEGNCRLHCDGIEYDIHMGQSLLLPAALGEIELQAEGAKLLAVQL